MPTAPTALEDFSLSQSAAARTQEFTGEASAERRREFEDVLSQALPRFRSIAARWLGNREDAEDAVQDAMLLAFTHIARFEGRAKMSTWLTAIVINAVRMQIRRRPRGRVLSLDWVPKVGHSPISELLVDPRATPDSALEHSELCELAINLTRRLPLSQQTALRHRYQDELSIGKTSTKLGVPEGTLKAQLARGRAKLRERLQKAMTKPKIRFSGSGSTVRRGTSSFACQPDHSRSGKLPISVLAEPGGKAWVHA